MAETDTILAEIGSGDRRFPFRFVDNRINITINRRILEGETYPLFAFVEGVACIVDVGANIGAASVYFRLHYPGARVFAFEPSAGAFALLEENAQAPGGITAVNCALFKGNRTLLLHGGSQDSVTSSVVRNVQSGDHHQEIAARDAEEKFAEEGIGAIDILKVDSEGCERQILDSIRTRLAHIKVIYLEFHSADDRLWIDRLLADTHVLCSARVDHPHRGELAYVARRCLPDAMSAGMELRIA